MRHSPSLTLIALATFSGLAASGMATASGRAAESVGPLKTLGRGISKKRGDEKLQMACVGVKSEDSPECGCEKLQFLLTDEGGNESFVGPVIEILEGRPVREQLDEKMKELHLKQTSLANHVRDHSSVGVVIDGVPPGNQPGAPTEPTTPTTIAGIPIPFKIRLGHSAISITGHIKPLEILSDEMAEPVFTINADSIKAMNERAQLYWQITPKKIKPKKFEAFLEQLRFLEVTETPTSSESAN